MEERARGTAGSSEGLNTHNYIRLYSYLKSFTGGRRAKSLHLLCTILIYRGLLHLSVTASCRCAYCWYNVMSIADWRENVLYFINVRRKQRKKKQENPSLVSVDFRHTALFAIAR